MRTNCAPFLGDLLLCSYDTDLMQGILKNNEKKPVRFFNFTFRETDDFMSFNNS
jgi:hypothetical protein